MTNLRIGHGYDVHRLTEGRALILGGVTIPYEKGLLGHSDADVLTHAVMDALLGAAALGDIGKLFPDSADEFAGISSLELLRRVKLHLAAAGYDVVNIDATILAQAPKLAPYREQMRANIARELQIDVLRVSVKATTEEHLGFTGSGEGMAAHAIALLERGQLNQNRFGRTLFLSARPFSPAHRRRARISCCEGESVWTIISLPRAQSPMPSAWRGF